jgi:hypothetical protein
MGLFDLGGDPKISSIVDFSVTFLYLWAVCCTVLYKGPRLSLYQHTYLKLINRHNRFDF